MYGSEKVNVKLFTVKLMVGKSKTKSCMRCDGGK